MDNQNLNNENIGDDDIDNKSSGDKNTKKYKMFLRQKQRVLPGHHFCDCQGTEHDVLNNCLNCGRIACIQEGSGPCAFCGHLVLSKAEMLNKANDLKEEHLIPSECKEPLSLAKLSEDLQKALQCKDKLLEYQKDSVRRTTIYDDQSDYFMMNGGKSWLSDKERAEMEGKYNELLAKKYAPRSERKIIVDFGPDEIVEQSTSYNLCSDEFAKSLEEGETILPKSVVTNEKIAAEYIPRVKNLNFNNAEHVGRAVEQISRVQDDYITEIHDSGICLSVHQPFASLLIRGIKRFEGRSWYSTHRGLLWIASTAKPLNHEEKEQIESFYLRLYNDQLPKPFPEQYITGCLLGCVNMVDCLPQEQFFEQYSYGEVESPYVFIFENPVELAVKIPISGKRLIIRERLQVSVECTCSAKKRYGCILCINVAEKYMYNVYQQSAGLAISILNNEICIMRIQQIYCKWQRNLFGGKVPRQENSKETQFLDSAVDCKDKQAMVSLYGD
ncbi:activating signal cointegrator 1 [Trichinella spiralis]|uniref:activating signal cointegrator 1 n=1 Tax=Trichinella spiralis TaxID=6334 RepID=UPI0001EFB731|nr:activating signal cointegrator 1 [Trichinella spiralis]